MDAGKFYAVPFLLLMVTILGLERARTGAGRIGKPALFVLAAFACLAIGTALEFWGFPFGSYEVTFEEGMNDTWWVQMAGTFFLTAALVPFGMQHARAGSLPAWLVPVLLFGALSTVYLTPAFFFPGIVWILLGFVLLRQPWGGVRP